MDPFASGPRIALIPTAIGEPISVLRYLLETPSATASPTVRPATLALRARHEGGTA
jgi:hypothetical protein